MKLCLRQTSRLKCVSNLAPDLPMSYLIEPRKNVFRASFGDFEVHTDSGVHQFLCRRAQIGIHPAGCASAK